MSFFRRVEERMYIEWLIFRLAMMKTGRHTVKGLKRIGKYTEEEIEELIKLLEG